MRRLHEGLIYIKIDFDQEIGLIAEKRLRDAR